MVHDRRGDAVHADVPLIVVLGIALPAEPMELLDDRLRVRDRPVCMPLDLAGL